VPFKHALVQDTAYSLLLRGPRRAVHARIANALQEQFPEVSAAKPENHVLKTRLHTGGVVVRGALI
jgi:predicted ATPase